MSATEGSVTEVLQAFGDAAERLGSYLSRLVEEQPAVAVATALAAGFVAGGGLVSPVGTRATAVALRATAGNLASLVVLDVLRRALQEDGEAGERAPGSTAE